MADLGERLSDADWLEREYVGEGRSVRGLAANLSTSPNTVRGALIAHGIGTRSPGPAEKVSDRDLLASIREAADDADGPLTMAEYGETAEHSAQVAVDRFGSWAAAKERAEVD